MSCLYVPVYYPPVSSHFLPPLHLPGPICLFFQVCLLPPITHLPLTSLSPPQSIYDLPVPSSLLPLFYLPSLLTIPMQCFKLKHQQFLSSPSRMLDPLSSSSSLFFSTDRANLHQSTWTYKGESLAREPQIVKVRCFIHSWDQERRCLLLQPDPALRISVTDGFHPSRPLSSFSPNSRGSKAMNIQCVWNLCINVLGLPVAV